MWRFVVLLLLAVAAADKYKHHHKHRHDHGHKHRHEATSEVLGAPDVHLKSGSALRLVCRLLDSTEPPVYVFWYHDSRMINYDELRGVTVEASAQGSTLSIAAARREDSGNYTCAPSNARAASIVVHVLEEEKPAAMQHDSRSCGAHLSASLLLSVMLCLLAR